MHCRSVTETPRISVIISSYNNARFVSKKLTEIQAQTNFKECEFLFIETASPEKERELFAPFCRDYSNCRLIALDDRKTLYEAWNVGWREARAPLVCYSNMDDAMHPCLLQEVAPAMERHRWDACTVLIAKQPLDDHWNDWSRAGRLPLSTRPGPFTAWRRELSDRVGWFDERFRAAGDKEFWGRLTAAQVRTGLIPKVLYLYTRNPASLSVSARGEGASWRHEKALLAGINPTWPTSIRWRIRCVRLLRAFHPSRFAVPLPASPRA